MSAVHFIGPALQPAGERARARAERPEEEEAERVARLAAKLERADEAQVHGIQQAEEQDGADARGDERRPQDPDELFQDASFTMRHVERGSSMTIRQRPGGSSGSSAS